MHYDSEVNLKTAHFIVEPSFEKQALATFPAQGWTDLAHLFKKRTKSIELRKKEGPLVGVPNFDVLAEMVFKGKSLAVAQYYERHDDSALFFFHFLALMERLMVHRTYASLMKIKINIKWLQWCKAKIEEFLVEIGNQSEVPGIINAMTALIREKVLPEVDPVIVYKRGITYLGALTDFYPQIHIDLEGFKLEKWQRIQEEGIYSASDPILRGLILALNALPFIQTISPSCSALPSEHQSSAKIFDWRIGSSFYGAHEGHLHFILDSTSLDASALILQMATVTGVTIKNMDNVYQLTLTVPQNIVERRDQEAYEKFLIAGWNELRVKTETYISQLFQASKERHRLQESL